MSGLNDVAPQPTEEMQRLLTCAREALVGSKISKAERALESLQGVFDRHTCDHAVSNTGAIVGGRDAWHSRSAVRKLMLQVVEVFAPHVTVAQAETEVECLLDRELGLEG